MRAFLICAFLLVACGPTMVTYYKGVATAGAAASTCYDAVDAADQAKGKEIASLIGEGDRAKAMESAYAWRTTRAKARKACDSIRATAKEAYDAGPTVEKAINREKDVDGWLEKLTRLALDTWKNLKELGIKVEVQ